MVSPLAQVPGLLAAAFGTGAITWRATIGSGTYATLAGAFLSNRRQTQSYDARHGGRERLDTEATLITPDTSPALPASAEILEADGTTWAIISAIGDAELGVRQYAVRRDQTIKHTEDRGRIA